MARSMLQYCVVLSAYVSDALADAGKPFELFISS